MDNKDLPKSRFNTLVVIIIISIVVNLATLWYVHDKLEFLLKLMRGN